MARCITTHWPVIAGAPSVPIVSADMRPVTFAVRLFPYRHAFPMPKIDVDHAIKISSVGVGLAGRAGNERPSRPSQSSDGPEAAAPSQ
jgi:hypothetical protein